jgi:hypothetical protein
MERLAVLGSSYAPEHVASALEKPRPGAALLGFLSPLARASSVLSCLADSTFM